MSSLTKGGSNAVSPHANDFMSSDQFTVTSHCQVQRNRLSNKGKVPLFCTPDPLVHRWHKTPRSLHVFIDSAVHWIVWILDEGKTDLERQQWHEASISDLMSLPWRRRGWKSRPDSRTQSYPGWPSRQTLSPSGGWCQSSWRSWGWRNNMPRGRWRISTNCSRWHVQRQLWGEDQHLTRQKQLGEKKTSKNSQKSCTFFVLGHSHCWTPKKKKIAHTQIVSKRLTHLQ